MGQPQRRQDMSIRELKQALDDATGSGQNQDVKFVIEVDGEVIITNRILSVFTNHPNKVYIEIEE